MADILLLEDDLVLAEQIKEVLEYESHSVTNFSSVPEAIAHLDTNPVDLIVSDIFIHGQDGPHQKGGVTLISMIKQVKSSEVPVIAISGGFAGTGGLHDSSSLVRETAITVGANAILAKPFAPQELTDLVNDLLDGRSKLR